jgi:hypothetical protein
MIAISQRTADSQFNLKDLPAAREYVQKALASLEKSGPPRSVQPSSSLNALAAVASVAPRQEVRTPAEARVAPSDAKQSAEVQSVSRSRPALHEARVPQMTRAGKLAQARKETTARFLELLQAGARVGIDSPPTCGENELIAAIHQSTCVGRDNALKGGFAATAARCRQALIELGPVKNPAQIALVTAVGSALEELENAKFFLEKGGEYFFTSVSPATLAALVRGIGKDAYTEARDSLNRRDPPPGRKPHYPIPSPEWIAQRAGIDQLWDVESISAKDSAPAASRNVHAKRKRGADAMKPDALKPDSFRAKRHDAKSVDVRGANASSEAGSPAENLLRGAGGNIFNGMETARKLCDELRNSCLSGGSENALANAIQWTKDLLEQSARAQKYLGQLQKHVGESGNPPSARARLQEHSFNEIRERVEIAIGQAGPLLSRLQALAKSRPIAELAASIDSALGESSPASPAEADGFDEAWKTAAAIEISLEAALLHGREFEKTGEDSLRLRQQQAPAL